MSYPIEYQVQDLLPRRSSHRHRHDGDNVIADLDVNGNLVRSYVTPQLDANVSITVHGAETVTSYYNQDERQSVINLTDDTGVVVNDYAYSAYGDKVDALTGGDVEQRYTYTGRERSESSGDYYFRYRTYSAGTGSFLSRDPLGYVDGMSVYNGYFAREYGIDPMGLAATFEDCSASQIKEIEAAHKEACDSLDGAVKGIKNYMEWRDGARPRPWKWTLNCVLKWFGPNNDETKGLKKILKVLEKSAKNCRNASFECECKCKKRSLAYVYGAFSDIHLCPGVFGSNKNDFAAVIIHEITHDSAGTDDEGYLPWPYTGNVGYPVYRPGVYDDDDLLDNVDTYAGFCFDCFM